MNHRPSPKTRLTALAMGSLLTATVINSCATRESATESSGNTERAEILFADPTIHSENGKYYLTGTRNREPLGFVLLESENLTDWHECMDSMLLTPGERVYGSEGFWAPQIIKNSDGSYLLAYTANEQTVIADADSLRCPFSQAVAEPIDGSEKNIDPFLFRDEDGKEYLYHVRFNKGNFLWVGEYDPTTKHIKSGTLQQCFANTQDWENTPDYPSDPIMEGPTVVKLDGTYYLFYSANHFMSKDYAVGYATAPTPLGPWTKNADNPIIHRSIVGENGAGHGDLFKDKDGGYRYVYHVHNSDSVVSPRRTRIVSLRLTPSPEGDTPYKITADSTSIITPLYAVSSSSN